MHGGTISAVSQGKDKGATFRIILPLHPGEPVPTTDIRTRAHEPVRRKILLVEDHGDSAMMMRALLETSGYQVQAVGDVKQALEAAVATRFDLLISDLGLPDRSGLELVKELRARGILMKAIALSGYGREEDVTRSREAGFIAHLTKPVEVETLIRAVEEAI
jgi:CheY-like chemotaxis protein